MPAPGSLLEMLIVIAAACLIVASGAVGGVNAHQWLGRRGFSPSPDVVVLVSVAFALLLAGVL